MIAKSFIIEKDINTLNNNLVLFYGENLGLKNFFKKKLKIIEKSIKTLVYSQDEIVKNAEIIFTEVLNKSLFDKEKIIFINDANDKILPIIQEIENLVNNQKIYLFAELLDKKSKLRNYFEKSKDKIAVPCYADNEVTIKKIILNKLKNFKGVTTQNINLILQSCNLERDKLYSELDKIITCFDNNEIDDEKLIKLLNVSENDNFSVLKDEALNGNKIKTNRLLKDTFIHPEKNFLFLNMFNKRLIDLSKIDDTNKSTTLEEKMDKIKPPIFWKDKPFFIQQSKKWNKHKIRKALSETYNLELRIKSNSLVDQGILIRKLIVDICELANI
jgi:DNA polymerase III subunit delta